MGPKTKQSRFHYSAPPLPPKYRRFLKTLPRRVAPGTSAYTPQPPWSWFVQVARVKSSVYIYTSDAPRRTILKCCRGRTARPGQ